MMYDADETIQETFGERKEKVFFVKLGNGRTYITLDYLSENDLLLSNKQRKVVDGFQKAGHTGDSISFGDITVTVI
jgi:hypothetical protein